MTTIKQIFDEIAAESSINKKVEILAKHRDNEILKNTLYLANSPRVKFYIKQIPKYSPATNVSYCLYEALDDLKVLSNREVTGNAAIEFLKMTLEGLSADDSYVVERVIEKDCKLNMGISLINRVFEALIEDTPYMGAKAYNPTLVKKLFEGGKKAYSQKKMDGRYCNSIIWSGNVELESRQGEPTIFSIKPLFLKELEKFADCVLNGELTIPGKTRFESNGIISSLISIGGKHIKGESVEKEISDFEKEHGNYEQNINSIVYTVWDVISIQEYDAARSNRPYSERLEDLEAMVETLQSIDVKVIEYKIVSSVQEALEHFQEMLNAGEEGTVLKAMNGIWKDGKHPWQVKIKKEINLDLRIVGFNYGTGKNKKLISSIDVESEDGLLKTSPTGMKESVMKKITEEQDSLLGTILEIKCSGLSKDKIGNYSVLHPVYKNLRVGEKNAANTLKECIEIDKSAIIL